MDFELTELPWLPRRPQDFRQRIKALAGRPPEDAWPVLRELAGTHLGVNQLIALDKALQRAASSPVPPGLDTFRLGVVSNATTDFLAPALRVAALRHGIVLQTVSAGFGQFMQAALDPDSEINRASPDAVLVAVDQRGLPFRPAGDAAWPINDHVPAFADLMAVRDGFRAACGAPCILQTLPQSPGSLFGNLDATVGGTPAREIAAFNQHLVDEIATGEDVLLDTARLAAGVGLQSWYDDRQWYLARMPFAQKVLPLYADHVGRLVAALRGRSAKCLVLDLDNTLWSGVIGDAGMEGVRMAEGDPVGEPHRAIQVLARDLRRRGIVLAVCSKNSEEFARQPFKEHPDMILREADIAVFVANWEDKAGNLERIAGELNIGLDSLVFLDDNPAERAVVRQLLPQVRVPELGDDPETFPRAVLAAGYFESVAFTGDDLKRADQYRGNARRTALQRSARDLDSFLQSLDMRARLESFTEQGLARITQLVNKTNQFNLTTRRYSEAQIREVMASDGYFTLQIGLTDRFGDNGTISVVICRRGERDWEIDSWLMSCRVINRRVEEMVCNELARAARAAGAQGLRGIYLATERNALVADLYPRLGFDPESAQAGASDWRLDLSSFTPFDVPIVYS